MFWVEQGKEGTKAQLKSKITEQLKEPIAELGGWRPFKVGGSVEQGDGSEEDLMIGNTELVTV